MILIGLGLHGSQVKGSRHGHWNGAKISESKINNTRRADLWPIPEAGDSVYRECVFAEGPMLHRPIHLLKKCVREPTVLHLALHSTGVRSTAEIPPHLQPLPLLACRVLRFRLQRDCTHSVSLKQPRRRPATQFSRLQLAVSNLIAPEIAPCTSTLMAHLRLASSLPSVSIFNSRTSSLANSSILIAGTRSPCLIMTQMSTLSKQTHQSCFSHPPYSPEPNLSAPR